ncbi:nucleoside 2-deoxyribosyltransferase [Uruburuella testudinis]|uniref:Nucleoside 2-deoxyribosyltransferase n=1 Tax=Uruburuella testudinis TaxID=1282863 RepID=A0ABY4DQ44_9NEIS|nr:nucleoside 2-deoxyribosyltransferase [Uruburuella testudinis]UOO80737.1 nucleoside 2-deoxyribosyltransferase [Uruburuella testudinis]
MHTFKIYCAGGDVFLPENTRNTVFTAMKQQAAALSGNSLHFELLIPTDNELTLDPAADAGAKRRNALIIRRANEAMIRSCDAVIANLSPFRSNEPDCGTAYECGYAAALGKTVLVYTDNDADQTEKYQGFDFGQSAPDKRFAYTGIEDFALPFNLMMYDDAHPIFSSFHQALAYFQQQYLNGAR